MSTQNTSRTVLKLADKGGRLAAEQRRFTAALRYLNQALKLDPENAHAHRFRGLVYRERQQYTRAKRDLVAAVNLDPHSSASHLFLGVFLVDRSAYRWGLYHLEQSLVLETDRYVGTESAASLVRLYAYHRLGQDHQAREVCDQLLAGDPHEPCYQCLAEWLTLRIGCQDALTTDSQTRQILAGPRFSTRCGDWPGLYCRCEAWRVLSIYVLPDDRRYVASDDND